MGTPALGTHVEQRQGSIKLHQSAYVTKILDRFALSYFSPVHTPCDPKVNLEKSNDSQDSEDFAHKYLSMFGSLNYLPTVARPNLAYAVSLMGRYNSYPTQKHMDAMRTA